MIFDILFSYKILFILIIHVIYFFGEYLYIKRCPSSHARLGRRSIKIQISQLR